MGAMRPESLFLATALAHISLAGYTLLRITAPRADPAEGAKRSRRCRPTVRVTPEALRLDPRPSRTVEQDRLRFAAALPHKVA